MAFTDNFNRAGPSPGSSWATVIGSNWVINSSLYLKPVSTSTYSAIRVVGTFPSDQFAEVWCEVPTPGGLNRTDAGPAVRLDASGNGYYIRLLKTDLALYKYNAGTHTYINDHAISIANDTLTQIRLDVTGTTLTVSMGGVTQFTATDSTFSSGNPGCAGVMGDAGILPRFDDFVSTDLSVAGIMPQASYLSGMRNNQ